MDEANNTALPGIGKRPALEGGLFRMWPLGGAFGLSRLKGAGGSRFPPGWGHSACVRVLDRVDACERGQLSERYMDSPNKVARIAGLLYLVEIVTGIFSLMYVPSRIRVHGDAMATVQHLMANEFLFRLDVVIGSISDVIALVLPLVLYKLLSPVSKHAAVFMVAFGVVFIPIDLVAAADQLDILSLLSDGSAQHHALSSTQYVAQVMALFDASYNKTLVSELFWGLWLLPFGYLVVKSGFLPKILGYFLMLGSLSYLVPFIVKVLFPSYSIPDIVSLPSAIGEIGTALWLAFVGIRRPMRDQRAG
jgi:hypothetical protein